MHKGFYASGFIYHIRSQQILLQQQITADNNSEWSLFGVNGSGNQTAEEVFKKAIQKLLHIELKPKAVLPIYKYFLEEMKKDHYICYAKISKLEKFPATKKTNFGWFSFKQIQKLNLSEQTKHDLVVGQRVINSALRKSLGQQTIE